jgi:mono/diheme cytochrome c family protein
MRTFLGLLAAILMISSVWLVHAQSNWQIPAAAKTEKSPLKPTPDVLKKGRGIFTTRCQKCHGSSGLGDGPDAEPKSKPANLVASKADENPDGVLFYKIWNGRAKPRMPAMKMDLTRDEVWTLVHYVKTLRREPAPSRSVE